MYQHEYLMEKLREFDREACRPCMQRVASRRSGPFDDAARPRSRGIRDAIALAPDVRKDACHDCC